MEKLFKFFKFKENRTDAKTEVIAGITTFMTMAYILAVNPSILRTHPQAPTDNEKHTTWKAVNKN